MQNKCSIEITWHFLASSPGKGTADGIAWAIKRLRATEVIVRDISAIKVFNITADEVNQRINTTELKAIIDNAPPLPGIFTAHCLKSENGFVTISQYSDQINENVVADESPINDYGASVQIRSYVIIP